jgi:formylglycine-generating enzyme required for sulfatase activity
MTPFDPIWAKATRKGGQPMAEAGAGEKLKVFISYSRKDSAAFADELVEWLELARFKPSLDRHDIAAGEEWEARLGGLIEQSDTVVFVVSPEAIKSDRCEWEVDKTLALSKRLFAIIHIAVPDNLIPEKLRRLQFVRFDVGPSVTRPLKELADALRQDLNWIRDHTRLGEIATRWDRRGRPESLLLRGDDIDAAKKWMTARNAAAPEITDAQHAFIRASEKTEKLARRRTQRVQALVGALMVLLALGGVGWWQQDFLREQYYWRTAMGPSVLTVAQEKEKAAKPGSEFTECAIGCPTMVVVPAGKFMMGWTNSEKDRNKVDAGPQHEVTIAKPFAVGRAGVTFAKWDACVAAGACANALDSNWGRGERPVINVSWDDAKQYVAWLSRITGKEYRLLTEAEWEYAARAGTTTASRGDDIGKGNANRGSCGSQWDGKQEANDFGLYDMHRNVSEWVEDPWHKSYEDAPVDGSAWLHRGDASSRVVRGGNLARWTAEKIAPCYWSNDPRNLRVAARLKLPSDFRLNFVGFRLARTL